MGAYYHTFIKMTEKKQGRKRYMDLEEFLKFGKDLKVLVSDRLLETLEKERLLFPVFRISYPEEYVRVALNGGVVDSALWKEIETYEGKLTSSQVPKRETSQRLLEEGHPIENAWNSGKSFVDQPKNREFRAWKEFDVFCETGNGVRKTVKCAWTYYEQWQIYHLDEIVDQILRIPRFALLRGNIEVPESVTSRVRCRVPEAQDMHQTLANYQYRCQLHFETAFEDSGTGIVEGENNKLYSESVRKEGTDSFARAGEESWIEFIRELIRLYIEYEDGERQSLKTVVRRDILDACQLLIHAQGLEYMELAHRIGKHIDGRTFISKTALEYVLPDRETETIREGIDRFTSFFDEFIQLTGKSVESIRPNFVEKLVDYAMRKGNEALIVKTVGINEQWFVPAFHREEGLWSSLRTLSVAVESLGRDLGYGDEISIILNAAMGGQYQSKVKTLLGRKWNSSGQPGSVDETDSTEGLIQRIDCIRAAAQPGIGPYLGGAKLLRNYLSHRTEMHRDLFGERFIFLYRCLVLTAMFLFDGSQEARRR